MLQKFKQFIESLASPNLKFGVAVSGGIDSVVLCDLCAEAGLSFFIVHCNFGLRGEESMRDESSVRQLGETYGVEVFVKSFETKLYAEENKLSIQEAARALRYEWFKNLVDEKSCDFVLLAHHANDNIETVLMNFFRGTGLEGLAGMPKDAKHVHCLRPLLDVTKSEIEQYANEHQLDWVEDSSNSSNKYTRNFFRHEIFPALKKVYPQVEENLLNNIERFKSIQALYKIGVEKLKKEVCEEKNGEVHLLIQKFLKYRDTALAYEIIKDFGFGEKGVGEVMKLTKSETGRFVESHSHQIIRHRNRLIIAPKKEIASTVAVDEDVEVVQLTGGVIRFKTISNRDFSINPAKEVAQLDRDKIEFPLIIRKWKTGDYFYPLGMPKKKKLSRFFIDQKLSLTDKEKVWIVESNKKIIWVMGMRIDDRFKVTPQTKHVLLITQER